MVFEGNPEFGVELQPIDFAAVRARRAASRASRSSDPARPSAVLSEAFAHAGPAVVEAWSIPNEPPMPGHVTMAQALHFAKAPRPRRGGALRHHQDVIKDKIREVI